jgi:transcriptional regulator with XRE-family HTH domain
MATRERPIDRGTRLGRTTLIMLGAELRRARLDRGLSQRAVAAELDCSHTTVWRIESGEEPLVALTALWRFAAVVGLDPVLRCYPGPGSIRDAGHQALVARFRRCVGPSWTWTTEAPLPNPLDQRAWDVLLRGPVLIGVECETSPDDGQALERRLNLKQRDGGVDRLVLVLADTRHNRELVRVRPFTFGDKPLIRRGLALRALADGHDPGGNAVLLL